MLWAAANEEPIDLQIKKRGLHRIGYTLRKDRDAVEKRPSGAEKKGKTWRSRPTVEAESREAGKNCGEGKVLAAIVTIGAVS